MTNAVNFASRRRDWLRMALSTGLAIGGPLLAGRAAAAEWPRKPVRLVVAFAPGSSGDTLLRLLAPRLEAVWRQPVIVENKPGAGSTLGTEFVINSTDGHTLLLGTLSSLIPKYTMKGIRYDPATDIVPIYRIINYQTVLVSSAKTAEKARTLPELIALSRSTPQGLFFAGTGQSSIFNLSMAVVNRTLGIRYTAVDYNSVPNLSMALIREDAQLMMGAPQNLKSFLDSGQLHPVAVVDPARYDNLPHVPTLGEAVGYQGYLPLSWGGMFAPKGTPRAVIDLVAQALGKVLSDREFRRELEAKIGGKVLDSSPDQFAEEFRQEVVRWRGVIESLNMQPQ